MTVEETKVIDIISVDPKSAQVVLTISDHLDWSDTPRHLETLQAKLNSYLAFVESGEILDSYPTAVGRQPRIEVVFQFPPEDEGFRFLETAGSIIRSAGIHFNWRVFGRDLPN